MRFNSQLHIFKSVTGSAMFHLGMLIGEFVFIRLPNEKTTATQYIKAEGDTTLSEIKLDEVASFIQFCRWVHVVCFLSITASKRLQEIYSVNLAEIKEDLTKSVNSREKQLESDLKW